MTELTQRVANAGCPPTEWQAPGIKPWPVGRTYTQSEVDALVAAERERWKEVLEERGRIHGDSSRIYARLASAVRAGADDVVLGQLLRAEVRNRA